ncbi:MAG TPA: hypothetical protein VFE52_10590 [Devosia sp.]|jgi:hypothetical protein|nr:hypothetical protein [Devosia sp.]
MAEFDVAIVGTDALSGLLAAALARTHGKKVVRVGRPVSAQRLPRGLDLALPLATRPETWRLLRQGASEIAELLRSGGMAATLVPTRVDCIADLADSAAALDHIAHMAAGYGHQVARIVKGWAFRPVASLDREALDKRLPAWLASLGVASAASLAEADASLTVLAGDDAVFEHLPVAERPALLLQQNMSTTLLASSRTPQSPVRRFVDRGVMLLARPGQSVLAIYSGQADADARVASTLPGPFPVKRLATTRFRRFSTSDGAPLIGSLGERFVLAGAGDVATFLAPALARLIAGAPTSAEADWFAAHAPGSPRDQLVDFVPAAEWAA